MAVLLMSVDFAIHSSAEQHCNLTKIYSMASTLTWNFPSFVGIANTTSSASCLFSCSNVFCCAAPHLHGLFPVNCVIGFMILL